MRKLTNEVLDHVLELLKSGKFGNPSIQNNVSWIGLADAVNNKFVGLEISIETLRRSRDLATKIRNPDFEVKDVAADKKEVYPEDYQRLLEANDKLNKKLMNRQIDIDNIIKACLNRVDRMKFYPLLDKQKAKRVMAKHEMGFDAAISDLHFGAKIIPQEVMGLSEYNPDESKKRMNVWLAKILNIKEEDEMSHGLNKFTGFILGDLVDGNFFPKQTWNLALNEIEQVFFAVEDLGSRLRHLATKFTNIELFCVPGNHRWNGKKDNTHWSFLPDYMIYEILKRLLSEIKNIKIYISSSPKMVIRRGKKNFCISHGDESRSWAGIPFYGIDRTYRRLPNLLNMIIDYFIIGHFHDFSVISDKIIINGTLVGGSDLSINRMNITSRPSQAIWFYHEKYGINRLTNIYVSEERVIEKDEFNIYTPHDNLLEGIEI